MNDSQGRAFNFSVIKQKIIKTDEVLRMYVETRNKLKKVQQACKEIKLQYDQAISNFSRVQLEHERCSFNLQNLKQQNDMLTTENKELYQQKLILEDKYNQQAVQSQLSIKHLEDELQMLNEIKITAESVYPNEKQNVINSYEKDIENNFDNSIDLKVSPKKNLCKKKEFQENLQTCDKKSINKLSDFQCQMSQDIRDSILNKNNEYLNIDDFSNGEIGFDGDSEYKITQEVGTQTNKFISDRTVYVQTTETLKTLESYDLVFAVNKQLKHRILEYEGEVTELKLKNNPLKTRSTFTQTEEIDSDLSVTDILKEMSIPHLLEPMSPVVDEDIWDSMFSSPILTVLPELITPIESPIKEDNIDMFSSASITPPKLITPINSPLMKTKDKILDVENKSGEIINTKKSVTLIERKLRQNDIGGISNLRKCMLPIINNEFVKLRKSCFRRLIHKRHILNRKLKKIRKLRKEDNLVNILRSLKHSKINFTISNNSDIPTVCNHQGCVNFDTITTERKPLYPDQKYESYITEQLNCICKNCCESNMVLNSVDGHLNLVGFCNIKTESCTSASNKTDFHNIKPFNTLIEQSLNNRTTKTENILEALAEIVYKKMKEMEMRVPQLNGNLNQFNLYEADTELNNSVLLKNFYKKISKVEISPEKDSLLKSSLNKILNCKKSIETPETSESYVYDSLCPQYSNDVQPSLFSFSKYSNSQSENSSCKKEYIKTELNTDKFNNLLCLRKIEVIEQEEYSDTDLNEIKAKDNSTSEEKVSTVCNSSVLELDDVEYNVNASEFDIAKNLIHTNKAQEIVEKQSIPISIKVPQNSLEANARLLPIKLPYDAEKKSFTVKSNDELVGGVGSAKLSLPSVSSKFLVKGNNNISSIDDSEIVSKKKQHESEIILDCPNSPEPENLDEVALPKIIPLEKADEQEVVNYEKDEDLTSIILNKNNKNETISSPKTIRISKRILERKENILKHKRSKLSTTTVESQNNSNLNEIQVGSNKSPSEIPCTEKNLSDKLYDSVEKICEGNNIETENFCTSNTANVSIKTAKISNTRKTKGMSKLKLNILRQVRVKRQILRTYSGCSKFQTKDSVPAVICSSTESNNAKNDNKIKIVQNILICPNSHNIVDLMKKNQHCDNSLSNKEDSSQSNVDSSSFSPNEKIDADTRRDVKCDMSLNCDVLSKIMNEMDKSKKKVAVKKNSMSTKDKVHDCANEKQWRKGVLEIAESIYNIVPKSEDTQVVKHRIYNPKYKPGVKKKILLKRLLTLSNEEKIPDQIILEFKRLDEDSIAQIIIQTVSKDIYDKPEIKYYPAPLMTKTQWILLSLMVRLEQETVEKIMDSFLSKAEAFLFKIGCGIRALIPVTRLYIAVCKLRRDIGRMRNFCADAFIFMSALAVPLFFTVLTSWTEVLPMEPDIKNFPLAKVLIQVVHLKSCEKPGYNLLPLRRLFSDFYGYPKERWNCDEIFEELSRAYLRQPDGYSSKGIVMLCKNKDSKWVHKKINEFFKPLIYKIPIENVNFRATVIILIANICQHFKADNQFDQTSLSELQRWLISLTEDGNVPMLIKQSVDLSLVKLQRKKKKLKKPKKVNKTICVQKIIQKQKINNKKKKTGKKNKSLVVQ